MDLDLEIEMCKVSLVHIPATETSNLQVHDISKLLEEDHIYSKETGIIKIQLIKDPSKSFNYVVTAYLTDDINSPEYSFDGVKSEVHGTKILRHLNKPDLKFAKEFAKNNNYRPNVEEELKVYFGNFKGKDMTATISSGSGTYSAEAFLYKFSPNAFSKIKKIQTKT